MRKLEPVVELLIGKPAFAPVLKLLLRSLKAHAGMSEKLLFELTKASDDVELHGCIELLAETSDPVIKDWLLRKAVHRLHFKEAELSLIIAQTGDLLSALSCDVVDDEMLEGAVLIFRHLLDPPSRPILDYIDAEAALVCLLSACDDRPLSLEVLWSLCHIHRKISQCNPGDNERQANIIAGLQRQASCIRRTFDFQHNKDTIYSALEDAKNASWPYAFAAEIAQSIWGVSQFRYNMLALRHGHLIFLWKLLDEASAESEKAQELAEWVRDYLGISRTGDIDRQRFDALNKRAFDGIRAGGMGAFDKSSRIDGVATQVLAQTIDCLSSHSGVGTPLVLAGLRSGQGFLQQRAKDCLTAWQPEDRPQGKAMFPVDDGSTP